MHGHADELGGSLTVAHDGLRQIDTYRLDCRRKRRIGRIARGTDLGRVTAAGGSQQARIIGGGVAVDGDAIEGFFHGAGKTILQQLRFHRHVTGHKSQHRGHVGTDHPSAFGDTGDGHRVPAQVEAPARALGHGIGGHDAIGGLAPSACGQAATSGRQSGGYLVHRQRLAYDAGGERQHDLRWHPDLACQGLTTSSGVRHPPRPGAGIGIAGIDQQIARRRLREMPLGDYHRCGAKSIAGEHRGATRFLRQLDHHHIAPPGLFDTGASDTESHPRDRM